jgi:ATP-dependent helicase/DNAse subunit B
MRQRYAEGVERHGWRGVVLLAPTERQCREARRLILAETHWRGLWQPHVYTLDALAQTLLDAHNEPRAELPPMTQRVLLRQIVERLAQQNALSYFRSVYAFPGFLDMLHNFICRTKRRGLSPPQWLQATADAPMPEAQRRELHRIYADYQDLLQQRDACDADDRLSHARALLLSERRAPFDSVKVLLLDGFEDLSSVEWDVVECLMQPIEEACFALTDDVTRPHLFGAAWAMREEIQMRFPITSHVQCPMSNEPFAVSSLTHLEHRLFNETFADKPPADDAVQIIEAAGQFREVEEVAREVKRLLLSGEATPGDIALLVRHLPDYAPIVQEVFAAFGVPVPVSVGNHPLRAPVVQTVLTMLKIVSDDFQREDVVKFLKSNYVDFLREDEASAKPSRRLRPDDLDLVARRARITAGRDSWQRRLRARARQLEVRLDKLEQGEPPDDFEESHERLTQELEQTRRALEFVEEFFQEFSPLCNAQTRSQFVAATRTLMNAFHLPQRLVLDAQSAGAKVIGDLSFNREDADAFERLQRAFEDLRFAEMLLNESEKTLSLPAFLGELQTALALTAPPPEDAEGCVAVMNVEDAAGLSFPYVFIAGLVEKEFPRSENVNLLSPHVGSSAEDFLFYTAATRASKRLYLCYPTTDAEGRAVLTSYYVDAVRQRFATDLTVCARAHLSSVVPDLRRVGNRRELLDAVFWGMGKLGNGETGKLPEGFISQFPNFPIPQLLHAAAIETHRRSPELFNQFDGVLSDAAIRADLATRFHAQHRFSAQQFNTFGQCPIKFFFRFVLNLQPLDEPTDDVEHRERGQAVHEILRRFFPALRHATNSVCVTPQNADAAQEVMIQTVNEYFVEQSQRGMVGDERLWDVEKEHCLRDLTLLLGHETKLSEQGCQPTHLEARYGIGDAQPLVIGSGGESVLVQGKIDRIDLLPSDEDAMTRFAVFDYKTRTYQRWQDIVEGTDFQLPLYALAAMRVVLRDENAQCVEWAYYKVRRPIQTAANVVSEGTKAQMAECLAATEQHLPRYAADIRSGQFPVAPRADVCGFCEYRHICRVPLERAR